MKPKVDLEANKRKVVRSRYISTELGIRERLVSAVLTQESRGIKFSGIFLKTGFMIVFQNY